MTLHKDSGLQQLLPELNKITQASLWYADESALPLIKAINLNPLLTLVSNRYDVYCCALENNLQAVFTDFTANDYPNHTIDKIIYRVSKEKALTHFLLNQSAQLLSPTGELIISGNKQDGIKSYGSKLNTQLKAQGKLKKQGDAYLGRYTSLNSAQLLNDQHYATLQKIDLSGNTRSFYSKPGVFGWNKIDKGTQLLLKALEQCYPTLSPQPAFALDLGCGYGWIFLNIDHYNFASITATDNNAGALLSAQKKRIVNKDTSNH